MSGGSTRTQEDEWAELFARERNCRAAFLVPWLILVIVAAIALTLPVESLRFVWLLLIVFVCTWPIFYVSVLSQLLAWPCPRCGKHFVSWLLNFSLGRKRCCHCGLQRPQAASAPAGLIRQIVGSVLCCGAGCIDTPICTRYLLRWKLDQAPQRESLNRVRALRQTSFVL